MPERDDNRTLGGGLPWAFVLDPAANAAAISEVQRRGLDAARRLIDGIVAQSDRSADHESDVPRGQGGPPDGSTRDEPLAELIRCWAQLTTEVLGKLAEDRSQPRPTGTGTAPNTVSVDVSDRFGWAKLSLDADRRGRLSAPSEIWLDNPSAQSIGPIALHADDLHTSDGGALAGTCVQFDPPMIDDLPPGSGQGVAVALSVEAKLAPGTYRGVIQSAAVPDLNLALQITVHPHAP